MIEIKDALTDALLFRFYNIRMKDIEVHKTDTYELRIIRNYPEVGLTVCDTLTFNYPVRIVHWDLFDPTERKRFQQGYKK